MCVPPPPVYRSLIFSFDIWVSEAALSRPLEIASMSYFFLPHTQNMVSKLAENDFCSILITAIVHVCWQLLCTPSSTRRSTQVFSGNRSWGIDIQKFWQLKEKNMGKDALFLGIANLRYSLCAVAERKHLLQSARRFQVKVEQSEAISHVADVTCAQTVVRLRRNR